MKWWKRLLYDPGMEENNSGAPAEGDDPGGGVATETPPSESTPPGGENPPASSGDHGSGGGVAADDFVLTKLPPKSNEAEFEKAWRNLSFEDQLKAEKELLSLGDGSNPELEKKLNEHLQRLSKEKGASSEAGEENKEEDEENEGQDSGAADNKNGEGSELKPITQKDIDALPEHVRQNILDMNKEIEELRPLRDPEFVKDLQALKDDPTISARLKDWKEGRVNLEDLSADIKNQFDPNQLIEDDTFQKLGIDIKNKEAIQVLSHLMNKSAQAGRDISKVQYEAEDRIKTANLELETKLTKQYTEMASENKSMLSDLPFTDEKHPLADFFKWTRDNHMTGKQISSIGMKNVYKSYLSATGNEEKLINKIASTTKERLFLQLEEKENEARNFGAVNQSGNGTPTGKTYNGIDLTRYLSDMNYRQKVFESADYPTQRKLERYANTKDPNVMKN